MSTTPTKPRTYSQSGFHRAQVWPTPTLTSRGAPRASESILGRLARPAGAQDAHQLARQIRWSGASAFIPGFFFAFFLAFCHG